MTTPGDVLIQEKARQDQCGTVTGEAGSKMAGATGQAKFRFPAHCRQCQSDQRLEIHKTPINLTGHHYHKRGRFLQL